MSSLYAPETSLDLSLEHIKYLSRYKSLSISSILSHRFLEPENQHRFIETMGERYLRVDGHDYPCATLMLYSVLYLQTHGYPKEAEQIFERLEYLAERTSEYSGELSPFAILEQAQAEGSTIKRCKYRNALHMAVAAGEVEIVEILLSLAPKLLKQFDFEDFSPLDYTFRNGFPNREIIQKRLLTAIKAQMEVEFVKKDAPVAYLFSKHNIDNLGSYHEIFSLFNGYLIESEQYAKEAEAQATIEKLPILASDKQILREIPAYVEGIKEDVKKEKEKEEELKRQEEIQKQLVLAHANSHRDLRYFTMKATAALVGTVVANYYREGRCSIL